MLFSGKREGSGQHGLVSKHTGEWMREGISQSSLGELNLSILRAKEKKGQGGQSEHTSRQKKDRQQCRRGRKCIKGQ